jgi:hypothetical protein
VGPCVQVIRKLTNTFMLHFCLAFLGFLGLLADGKLSVEDRAILPLLQRGRPALKRFIVLRRLAVNENLNLVVVLDGNFPHDFVPTERFMWTSDNRLGLFLQDRTDAGRVYQLAIKPGLSDDCFARIERITGQELVLSGIGEKWTTYDNQKFVFDVRAKALVKDFSYLPFSAAQSLQGSHGPQFVMYDTQQLLLVDIHKGADGPRVVPEKQARATLSRIPVEESTEGDRVFHTPVPPPDRTPPFGPRKTFRLSKQKNSSGGDSLVVVEHAGNKDKIYHLPQSDKTTWSLARPDDIERGIPPDQAEINEEIGPHQLYDDRLWFGRTFYNGEGSTGVGGFGYFDTETRSFHIDSPPEIRRWSVSAILVEPDFVWLALYSRGEYGNDSGSLLRWNRKTEQVRLFNVRTVIHEIVRHDNVLYMGAADGILVLRGDQVESYFVDRTTNGRYQIVAREGMPR